MNKLTKKILALGTLGILTATGVFGLEQIPNIDKSKYMGEFPWKMQTDKGYIEGVGRHWDTDKDRFYDWIEYFLKCHGKLEEESFAASNRNNGKKYFNKIGGKFKQSKILTAREDIESIMNGFPIPLYMIPKCKIRI